MLGICFLVLAIFPLAVISAASPRLADDAGPLAINVGRQKRGDRHLCQIFSSSVNCHADNLPSPQRQRELRSPASPDSEFGAW